MVEKAQRKSYTREFKLKVIRFYRKNNLYRTSKRYELNTKTVLRWIKQESKIKDASKQSKHLKHQRKVMHPEMEKKLYDEYKKLRKKGLKVKGYWFKLRAQQILKDMDSETTFRFSDRWFGAFKRRHKISLRRATNVAQKEPEDKRRAIQQFHRQIREVASEGNQLNLLGQFQLCQVANMDQTPLPFCFTDGSTYADTGEPTIWVRGGQSGLDKRQCTIQLTLFADGEPRVKPLLIFRGKGKRITFNEKVHIQSNYLLRFIIG